MAPIPDATHLRLTSGLTSAPHRQRARLPRHRPGERFLKGPIPWQWLTRAAQQPGRALHVAIAIWHWAFIKGSGQIALSISRLKELGVSRYAAYRGLKALERAGLISVHRQKGRKSVVTIMDHRCE